MHPTASRPHLALVLIVALVGGACGGDNGGTAPPIRPPVVGTWLADTDCQPPCAFALRSVADPDVTLDLLAIFEGELRVAVTETRFELAFQSPTAGQALEITGSLEIEPSELVVTGEEGTNTIGYTVTGDELELRFQEETQMFDLDGDGTFDTARLQAVLLRQ